MILTIFSKLQGWRKILHLIFSLNHVDIMPLSLKCIASTSDAIFWWGTPAPLFPVVQPIKDLFGFDLYLLPCQNIKHKMGVWGITMGAFICQTMNFSRNSEGCLLNCILNENGTARGHRRQVHVLLLLSILLTVHWSQLVRSTDVRSFRIYGLFLHGPNQNKLH